MCPLPLLLKYAPRKGIITVNIVKLYQLLKVFFYFISSSGSSISMKSVTVSPIIERFKRKLETSSSDSGSSRGVTKKIRKDIRLMHNYR